jgi:phosphoribosylaminoimidazolecarboxamide formyltransferase/IMP cyclohydrolase
VLAWRVCGRTTSNAIAIVNDGQAVGVGAGQQSGWWRPRSPCARPGRRAKGGAGASDAFFPFPDGCSSWPPPASPPSCSRGARSSDAEVIAAADEAGLAMVVTGERHFRH